MRLLMDTVCWRGAMLRGAPEGPVLDSKRRRSRAVLAECWSAAGSSGCRPILRQHSRAGHGHFRLRAKPSLADETISSTMMSCSKHPKGRTSARLWQRCQTSPQPRRASPWQDRSCPAWRSAQQDWATAAPALAACSLDTARSTGASCCRRVPATRPLVSEGP